MSYYLLERQSLAPRTPAAILVNPTVAQLQEYLPIVPGALWALDLETRGVEAHIPSNAIVGIGLANADTSVYVDIRQADDAARKYLKDFLRAAQLFAFNTLFDATFLQVWTGQWLDWVGDSYGLFKQLSTEGHPGQSWNLETAQLDVLGWTETNKQVLAEALKARGLGKSDMWQLPPDILGLYCAHDADAAWQLWHVLLDAIREHGFANLLDYHQRVFLTEVKLLAEQQLRGIKINQEELASCRADLERRIQSSMQAFLNHPQVAPHIAEHNKEVHAAWMAAQPPQTNKGGEVSKRWEAWRDREARHMADNGFNPNSKQQLANLFYQKLGRRPLKYTPTGRPVVDRKVLPALGEPGKLLADYNLYIKRRGYVERVIERSATDGLIHPQFNSVGTFTTRLSGTGGLNLQQMPKTPEFLVSFAARPGYKIVQADAEALEPVILAEFSQDKTLLTLYGPDAKQNDVYLFVAAKIDALGKEIRKHYDPENPTPEAIKAAKKHCKRDRAVAKIVQLASTYGAGAAKIHETLALAGIDITLREVRGILREYWELFAGVKRFEQQLLDIWTANGGWIPSAFGTPICVADSRIKDVTNAFCQYSGHAFLQLWIWHVDRLRQERGVEMRPWIVDLHDEQIWEAPEDQAEAAAQVLRDALDAANDELDMSIRIKGPPAIADTLGLIKCEGYAEWLATRRAG